MQEFTDAEVAAKAVKLGVIDDGQELPRNQRGRIVALLMQERLSAPAEEPTPTPQAPQLAREVLIQPGGAITIDGAPFPWLVAAEPMDIRLSPSPNGDSTVRLTLLAESVQIIKPESETAS